MSFCARGCGTPTDSDRYLCPGCWRATSNTLKRLVIWTYADLMALGTQRARDCYEQAIAMCLERPRRERLRPGAR